MGVHVCGTGVLRFLALRKGCDHHGCDVLFFDRFAYLTGCVYIVSAISANLSKDETRNYGLNLSFTKNVVLFVMFLCVCLSIPQNVTLKTNDVWRTKGI